MLETICLYSAYIPVIIFFLILLTGLNIPLSEDLLILLSGALVSTCLPGHYTILYTTVFFASLFSAWEAYWIGRVLGPKLYDIKLFSNFITPHRIAKLRHYIDKFGILTFIVGRFCPGGIRNGLFMTSGLSGMPFTVFIFKDCLACVISTSVLFYLGFIVGENYELFAKTVAHDEFLLLGIIVLVIVLIGMYNYFLKRK